MSQSIENGNFTVAYYNGDRKTGAINVVCCKNGVVSVESVPVNQESSGENKPIFIGLTPGSRVVLLDPKANQLSVEPHFPADAFPAHIYEDPYSNRDWFMNDGDKVTGNDTLNCGNTGSSVTVVENISSQDARFLKVICVGRGHHQATYTAASERVTNIPSTAYISNLKDGTLSVIGNDPSVPEHYLKLLATIDLCEPDKEKDLGGETVPNNAFPHGLVYSTYTGKVYNLNNGYGTIAIIDPLTHAVEQRIPFKGHSNLFISPCGRYVIGRGADRKSDPDHVVAKLTVLDLETLEITDSVDLRDIYISKYYYNEEGTKLFLTVSSSGSEAQQKNLKTGVVLVFDIAALPKLKKVKELAIGMSGSLAFTEKGSSRPLVFSSHTEAGELVVLDGENIEPVTTIKVNGGNKHSRVWIVPPRQ